MPDVKKPISRDYSYISCETCQFCGGWAQFKYAEDLGTYEVLMCAKPGFPPVNTWPEKGCAYWVEAPEIAVGFYDAITTKPRAIPGSVVADTAAEGASHLTPAAARHS